MVANNCYQLSCIYARNLRKIEEMILVLGAKYINSFKTVKGVGHVHVGEISFRG